MKMNDVATDSAITANEVDAMSAKRLNQFVLESSLDNLPDGFIEMNLATKQQAVKSVLFGTAMPKAPKAKAKPKAKPKAAAKPKTGTAVATKIEILPPGKNIPLPQIDFESVSTEDEAVAIAKDLVKRYRPGEERER